MRDLEKPSVILSCISTPAHAEQTNSNIQISTGARHKAGNEKLQQDQLKFSNIQKLPTWKLEESVIYNRANSYLATKQILLGQQRSFHILWWFFDVVGFFDHTQNCDTSNMLSLTCIIKLLRKKTNKNS